MTNQLSDAGLRVPLNCEFHLLCVSHQICTCTAEQFRCPRLSCCVWNENTRGQRLGEEKIMLTEDLRFFLCSSFCLSLLKNALLASFCVSFSTTESRFACFESPDEDLLFLFLDYVARRILERLSGCFHDHNIWDWSHCPTHFLFALHGSDHLCFFRCVCKYQMRVNDKSERISNLVLLNELTVKANSTTLRYLNMSYELALW